MAAFVEMNGPQHDTRVCDCGWHGPRFGQDKCLGTTDALPAGEDAADLQQ